jgi:hypothetical protein
VQGLALLKIKTATAARYHVTYKYCLLLSSGKEPTLDVVVLGLVTTTEEVNDMSLEIANGSHFSLHQHPRLNDLKELIGVSDIYLLITSITLQDRDYLRLSHSRCNFEVKTIQK